MSLSFAEAWTNAIDTMSPEDREAFERGIEQQALAEDDPMPQHTAHIEDFVVHQELLDERRSMMAPGDKWIADAADEMNRPPKILPDLLARQKQELATLQAIEGDIRDDWGTKDLLAFAGSVRHAMAGFVSLLDFDPDLEVAQLKVAEQMCRAIEKCRDNVQVAGEQAKAELLALDRNQQDTEFDDNEAERLSRRLKGLRVQYWAFNAMFRAMLDERAQIVGRSSINWPQYLTLKQMAESSATKRRMRQANSDLLQSMSEAEYRRWLAQHGSYTPRFNGVDAAADEAVAPRASEAIAFRRRQAEVNNDAARRERLRRMREDIE